MEIDTAICCMVSIATNKGALRLWQWTFNHHVGLPMFKKSEFTKTSYKTAEIMKILNVTYSTIKNYDKQGKLLIKRTETGRRIVFREDLLQYLDSIGLLYNDDKATRRDVIYARVSTDEQKTNGDLDRQVLFLFEHCNDLHNPLVIKEVGCALNDRREKMQALLDMVAKDEVNRIFVTYRDRLTRFGFHYLETFFASHNVELIIVNNEEKERVFQEELTKDIIALVASLSKKYDQREDTQGKYMDQTIMKEICTAIQAKDTLEKIIDYLKNTKSDTVSKNAIMKIIESQENQDEYVKHFFE